MKKYNIIYADPPWSYNDKMETHSFSELNHYSTMSLQEIKDLPIKELAEKDSVLFLWVVSPMLDWGFEVIKSWGFKYKTVAFVWSKHSKNGKKIANLGRWTMGNVEMCLIATKGKPKRIKNNVRQLVEAERTVHSKKPAEVAKRIVDLMGDLPRIELFARETSPGWDAWGNEVECSINLEAAATKEDQDGN
jgi:N6-adenosine-specific RNA methylase IME4